MKALFAVWCLLDHRQRRRFAAVQLLSVLMALSTLGGMAAVLLFFTVLAEPQAINDHLLLRAFSLHFADETRFTVALGVLLVISVLLSNGMNLLGTLAIDRFAFWVGDSFHTALFEEYLHRDYGFHLSAHSATLTSNVLQEIGRVASGILRHGLILVTSSITAVCIVGSMAILDPAVALLALLGLGSSYLLIHAIARAKLRRNGAIESEDFAARTLIVNEGFGAIKDLILLQAQPLFVARFSHCCVSISRTIISNLAIAQYPKHALECVTACALVGVALGSASRGRSTGPLIAQLSFIGLAVYRLLPVLQQMFVATARISAESPAFERIAVDLTLARSLKRAAFTSTDNSWRGRPKGAIHLRDAAFSHGSIPAAAIAGITLRIPAGASIGFIGANGSGKTTLLDLLSGLLVAQLGSIEIDGVTLDEATRRAWQTNIAYVPQHVFLCDATLAENIALGTRPAEFDRGRLAMAVRDARLDECVAALPNGYNEILGERGARLSHGQRQRVGIARALYRDSSVLMMDEATSALDPGTEREVTDMLGKRRDGRTTLLVAHRLAALRHCDVIYELSKGRIIRGGSYRQVLLWADPSDEKSEEATYSAVQAPVLIQR